MIDVALLAERQPVVCLFEAVLWEHGLHTIQRDLRILRDDPREVLALLAARNPPVLVCVVDQPYPASWSFLERLRPLLESQRRFLIPTTLHKAALERVVGPTDLVELTDREEDLQRVAALVSAARSAARSRGRLEPAWR